MCRGSGRGCVKNHGYSQIYNAAWPGPVRAASVPGLCPCLVLAAAAAAAITKFLARHISYAGPYTTGTAVDITLYFIYRYGIKYRIPYIRAMRNTQYAFGFISYSITDIRSLLQYYSTRAGQ